jgi:ribonucleoside-diphosphate reductase alpha chain
MSLNLSEVVVRADDTFATLSRKVRIATILGTMQATLTDFRYLRNIWKRNTEEEALLGVSLTGIMDNEFMASTDDAALRIMLEKLKQVAIDTNKEWAERLGINQSTAITCVKPSGTVSQLVDSASGIHPRFSRHYIRRVRADVRDPLCQVMKDAGVPWEADAMNPSTLVFSFPQQAPDGAVVVSDVGAMEQLRLWKIYQDHWCEHKPSITVYYKDSEFFDIGQWLYNNFDDVSGISFLPFNEHSYTQAPYEEITEERYRAMLETMPTTVEWAIKEASDVTESSQTLACVGASCEI